MTRRAVFGWYIRRISDDLRHVGLVALLTFPAAHVRRVWLVTLGAYRNPAMHAVTGAAIKRRMLALIFPELTNLTGVAGQAWIGNVTSEGDLQRCMGVFVAAQTLLQFKVGFAHMALVALGNRLLHCGRVADVTIYAPHKFVFPSFCGDIGRRTCMTLDTVVV